MKKLIMFLLCMSMCVMTVCAAGKASPLGLVVCDLQSEGGNIPLVDGKGGMDWFHCRSTTIEQKVDPYYIVNIYAMADIQGIDGMLYERAHDTKHHTKKASALTNKAYRRWDASPVKVRAVGLARARYTDNSVFEAPQKKSALRTLGGQNYKSALSVTNSNLDGFKKEEPFVLGEGLGDNMSSVINQVFSRDLSEYQYVCFDDLWVESVSSELEPLQDILIDLYIDAEVGERLPLGFLYQGTSAYTVVEQPDGSLTLSHFSLTPPVSLKNSTSGIGKPDAALYTVQETENRTASASIVASLYQ